MKPKLGNGYPWLTGHLGAPTAAVWFLGLYPSLTPVERIDRISPVKSPNLQWSCNDRGARLWREAVAEAGLKDGPSCQDCGWHCYITNVIKEVMGLKEQKLMKTKAYWQEQAVKSQGSLQEQIKSGSPKVMVVMGNQAFKILMFMKKRGLEICLPIERISIYSYITNFPDRKQGFGPNHPERVKQYKRDIADIACRYRH